MKNFILRPDTDVSNPEQKFFTWPDEDTSYMKMIWKSPTLKYPSGFHVLGTRYHPIGDFDHPDVMLPDEPMRIYQTRNGYRVFFTGRYDVDRDAMFQELDAMGGDRLYSKLARTRRYFASRVEPKQLPAPDNYAITRLVAETGPARSEWREFIDYHDQLTNAHSPDAVLV
jgi:hypothetical protein